MCTSKHILSPIILSVLLHFNTGFGSVLFYLADPDHFEVDPRKNAIELSMSKHEIYQQRF